MKADVRKVANRYKAICNIKTVQDLAYLLKTTPDRLTKIARNPKYKEFEIPKPKGGFRKIETPYKSLKTIQNNLNRYLQAAYYFNKTAAAHGFIMSVKHDNQRRNIISNARAHLRKPYLLNIDLKDFFHSVTEADIQRIFQSKAFGLRKDLAILLAQLTTYNGHLPMGTPTSPALSNFATIHLDWAIIKAMRPHRIYYTRYADDMSFSSHQPITDEHIASIRKTIEEYRFTVNENKVKLFGKEDEKIVTGLILKDRITLPDYYVPEVQEQIKQLHNVIRVQNLQGELQTEWVEDYKRRVYGRMNFVSYVMGRHHKVTNKIYTDYYEAINPPANEFGQYSWLAFEYVV